MRINTKTLSPWADINNILSRAKSLTVIVDGKDRSGDAELSIKDGAVTLELLDGKKSKKK